MTKIYLLRHGKVSGPAALYGKTDVLVDNAINQEIANNLFRQGLDIGCIYSSPLTRCLSLAQAIQEQQTVELSVVSDLQEMNFGIYDGIAFDELYQKNECWQSLTRFWQNPAKYSLPNAEHLSDFYQRTVGAWQQVIDEGASNALIVCHGGVIRMILAHVLGVDYGNARWFSHLEIGYGSMTTLELNHGDLMVKQMAQPLFAATHS